MHQPTAHPAGPKTGLRNFLHRERVPLIVAAIAMAVTLTAFLIETIPTTTFDSDFSLLGELQGLATILAILIVIAGLPTFLVFRYWPKFWAVSVVLFVVVFSFPLGIAGALAIAPLLAPAILGVLMVVGRIFWGMTFISWTDKTRETYVQTRSPGSPPMGQL